ncbi:MAG TPA: hypothetical protein VF742_12785 [Terracidiphilus sp.]|jgi:hypothetical protein
MQFLLRALCFCAAILSACGAVAQGPARVQPAQAQGDTSPAALPDAPQPQIAELEQAQQPAQSSNGTQNPQNGSQSSSQPAAGSQQPAQQESGQTQYEKAQQQLKQQEKQRAFWVIPSFNTTFTQDVAPLTKGQKIKLAFRSSIDPYTFAQALVFGGYRELGGDYSEYGWGAQGYFKRAGSAYADSFLGNMIGNGFLPAVWHQDPRYFRLGHGNVLYRSYYAAVAALRCKHDGTDRWEPNYSNVIGNMIAGGISNVYYPESQRGWGHTFTNGLVNTATGMVGAQIQEFAPDIVHRFKHKAAHRIDAGQPQPDQEKKP